MQNGQEPAIPPNPDLPAGGGRNAAYALRRPPPLQPVAQQGPAQVLDVPAPPRAAEQGRMLSGTPPVSLASSEVAGGGDLVGQLLSAPQPAPREFPSPRHLQTPAAAPTSPMRHPPRPAGRAGTGLADFADELLDARVVTSTESLPSPPGAPRGSPASAEEMGALGDSATSVMTATEFTGPLMSAMPSGATADTGDRRLGRVNGIIQRGGDFDDIVDALLAPSSVAPSVSPARADDATSPLGPVTAGTVATPSSPASAAETPRSDSLHYTAVLAQLAAAQGRPAAASGASTPRAEAGAPRPLTSGPAPGGTPR